MEKQFEGEAFKTNIYVCASVSARHIHIYVVSTYICMCVWIHAYDSSLKLQHIPWFISPILTWDRHNKKSMKFKVWVEKYNSMLFHTLYFILLQYSHVEHGRIINFASEIGHIHKSCWTWLEEKIHQGTYLSLMKNWFALNLLFPINSKSLTRKTILMEISNIIFNLFIYLLTFSFQIVTTYPKETIKNILFYWHTCSTLHCLPKQKIKGLMLNIGLPFSFNIFFSHIQLNWVLEHKILAVDISNFLWNKKIG